MQPVRLNKLRPFASLEYHNDSCLAVDHEATHSHAFLRQTPLDVSVQSPRDGASKTRRLGYERLLHGLDSVQRVSEIMILHLGEGSSSPCLDAHTGRWFKLRHPHQETARTRETKEPNSKAIQIDGRAESLVKTEVYKALALVGAALISIAGFMVLINWSDFGTHDCYSYSGCASSLLQFFLSYVVYVAPFVLMGSLGSVMVLVGFRGLTGVTRTRYIVWIVLVGVIVLMSLYACVLFPWMVQPPSGTSTTTNVTTVG